MSLSAGNAITIRIEFQQNSNVLAEVISIINNHQAHVGAIDIIRVKKHLVTRDITVQTSGEDHGDSIVAAIREIEACRVINISDRTFLMHLGGKIETKCKTEVNTRDKLSMAYTPGVARVCMAIHEDKNKAHNLTIKKNTIAIISDGTAVLGLGDIGPEAAMPVMEGKAMLFKSFADVDAFPLCLDTKDTEEIIRTVKAVAPTFGGINLEDISAPRCFEIEERLKAELDIPVFHDDQHGTAVVMTAAFINALKVTGQKAEDLKIIVAGVGAAGTACTKMLLAAGAKNIIGCDRKGALTLDRSDLNDAKKAYAAITNPNQESGSIKEVMRGADVFVGLSGPSIIDVDDLKAMNPDPIVFAMSNPTPEIMPEDAYPHVAVMATGRSDYPNQINNVLCFPGIFKGALACQASDINEEMKLAAAIAIAECIDDDALSADYIIPSVFDKTVVRAVTKAVTQAAKNSGLARKS